jgi:ankyrin repeat protein
MRLFLFAVSVVAVSAAGPNADTRLVDAAKNQDRATLLSLLKQHASVNATDPEGETALYWAAHWGDAELVDALTRAGANVNIASRYGLTPLWEAAQLGNAEIVGMLLKKGADVHIANPQGETALLAAARAGNVEAVKLLVDHGSDVNQKENWRGETALMLAAAEGHADVIRVLLAHGANPNLRSTSFDLQDRDGIVGLQASLYWKGGLTALLFAARQGYREAGQALVEGGADMSSADTDFRFTPLMEAIFNGHLDFAQMLVEKGANLNDGSLYLLVDQRNAIPRRGDEQTVAGLTRLLLDRGADPNTPFNNGKIPPRITYPAIRYGPVAAGSTPLLAAARTQDVALMRLLLDKHADPNKSATVDRFTPLMAALSGGGGGRGGGRGANRGGAVSNPIEAVQLLIDRGADVNAVNSRGMTPMHYAARTGNDRAIQLLAEHGANLDAKDRLGRTPKDMANGVLTAVSGADGPPNPRTAALIDTLLSRR